MDEPIRFKTMDLQPDGTNPDVDKPLGRLVIYSQMHSAIALKASWPARIRHRRGKKIKPPSCLDENKGAFDEIAWQCKLYTSGRWLGRLCSTFG